MATFITTTLTRRTGATTTVFSPSAISDGVGFLYAPGTIAGYAPVLSLSQRRVANSRRSIARVLSPQLSADGREVLFRPWAQIEMYIPDGSLQADVNDLVGYLNAFSATGLSNGNDLLVNGVGVY